MPWTSEYRPNTLQDVVGNSNQISKLKKWADNWSEDSDPVILYGPPGLGKTTSAHALGLDKGWEVMEMNASDKRTGKIINRIAGESSKTASLTGQKRKLIILDESDNLHGNSDRGGKGAITKTIKNSSQPIILIANDYYDLTRGLRNATEGIEFKAIDETEVAKALRDICEDKNIDYDVYSLKKIAKNSKGDLRAAINDLQKNAVGKDELRISQVNVDERDKDTAIFPFLDFLLKTGDVKDAQEEARKLDMTPEEIFRWVNENLPRKYSEEELTRGLDNLAKADIWLSRTRKTQNYKYWKYANDELTAGVASARDGKKGGWTRWQPPKWHTKKGVSEELLGRIATKSGSSIQTVRMDIIPFLSAMVPYCKPRELTVQMASWYDMDASEVAEITGSGKTTNKVQSIVEYAEEIKQEFEIKSPEESLMNIRDEQESTKNDTDTITEPEIEDDTDNQSVDEGDEKDEGEDDNQAGLDDFL